MRRFVKVTGLALLVNSALANAGYIEIQVGQASADVSTETYSGTASGVTVTGFGANLDYDTSFTAGLEFGGNITENIRMGASFTTMDLDFEKAVINGSITDGTTTLTGPLTITAADAASVGVTFDNEVNIYQLHGYYDFAPDAEFRPYVGGGIGFAEIENAADNELALSASIGGNYMITDNAYIGVRISAVNVGGVTDKLGIPYDDTTVTSAAVSLGISF